MVYQLYKNIPYSPKHLPRMSQTCPKSRAKKLRPNLPKMFPKPTKYGSNMSPTPPENVSNACQQCVSTISFFQTFFLREGFCTFRLQKRSGPASLPAADNVICSVCHWKSKSCPSDRQTNRRDETRRDETTTNNKHRNPDSDNS